MVAGLKPQVGSTALLHCIKMPLDFLHTLCLFQESLESRVIPRSFADFYIFISASSTLIGLLRDHFLLFGKYYAFCFELTEFMPTLLALLVDSGQTFLCHLASLKVSAS